MARLEANPEQYIERERRRERQQKSTRAVVRRQVALFGQSVGVSEPDQGGDAGDVGDAYTVIEESGGNVTILVEP